MNDTSLSIVFGMLGTALGVVSALIPQEVSQKKNRFELLSRYWRLLSNEVQHIIDLCDSHKSAATKALQVHASNGEKSIGLLTFTQLPKDSWRMVSNGSLIEHAPTKLLTDTGKLYRAVETLNDTLSHYSLFVETSRALSSAVNDIKQFYTVIESNCDSIRSVAQLLPPQYMEQESYAKRMTARYELLMYFLIYSSLFWFGLIGGTIGHMIIDKIPL